jgi:putative tricarboxylic transport membrane protein
LRTYNLVSSLFWFLVGLGFTLGGLHYGFGTWKEPGPGLLPSVFGILLSILSAVLFLTTMKSRRKTQAIRFWEMEESWKPILFTLLALVGYMLLLKPIGFILTTFLFAFVLLKFIGQKRWFTSILIASIFSLTCYGLFSSLLGTPLPRGQIYGSSFRHIARV